MPENTVPRNIESTARRLIHDLKKDSYEVERVHFKHDTQSECPYSYEVLRSCLGNNPGAPYVIPVLPAWPDEWVDPGPPEILGPTVEGYNASYLLNPSEAILILGKIPPQATYFGLPRPCGSVVLEARTFFARLHSSGHSAWTCCRANTKFACDLASEAV